MHLMCEHMRSHKSTSPSPELTTFCYPRKTNKQNFNTGALAPGLSARGTFTGLASTLIFPQDTASSGRAPASEPSNSWPVLTYTEKSAPFLWEDKGK